MNQFIAAVARRKCINLPIGLARMAQNEGNSSVWELPKDGAASGSTMIGSTAYPTAKMLTAAEKKETFRGQIDSDKIFDNATKKVEEITGDNV